MEPLLLPAISWVLMSLPAVLTLSLKNSLEHLTETAILLAILDMRCSTVSMEEL